MYIHSTHTPHTRHTHSTLSPHTPHKLHTHYTNYTLIYICNLYIVKLTTMWFIIHIHTISMYITIYHLPHQLQCTLDRVYTIHHIALCVTVYHPINYTYNVHCTVNNVHCIVYGVHHKFMYINVYHPINYMYTVQCTVYILYHWAYCIGPTVQDLLFVVIFSLIY